jgi:XTP/dITP diphosphohydrolase
MKTLVFATHNGNKAREIGEILGPDYRVLTLNDIGCHEEIAETEATLEGNAQLKARHVKDQYGYDCFSEDTGLEVDALDGAPGVHTARYAGDDRNPDANIDLLLGNLEEQENRLARFRTIVYLLADGEEHVFEGVCPGRIARARAGDQGWGYDPVFIPEGYEQTFAELGEEVKNKISHRARATQQLIEFLGSKT